MKLRNCPECGKVFTFIRTNLCPECQKKDEENFRIVRKFLLENPGALITEVSEKTGIGEEKILRYLKEGRFSVGTKIQVKLQCELCGAAINAGRYCLPCQEKLTAGLKKVIREQNEKVAAEAKKKQEPVPQKGRPRMHSAESWLEHKKR